MFLWAKCDLDFICSFYRLCDYWTRLLDLFISLNKWLLTDNESLFHWGVNLVIIPNTGCWNDASEPSAAWDLCSDVSCCVNTASKLLFGSGTSLTITTSKFYSWIVVLFGFEFINKMSHWDSWIQISEFRKVTLRYGRHKNCWLDFGKMLVFWVGLWDFLSQCLLLCEYWKPKDDLWIWYQLNYHN